MSTLSQFFPSGKIKSAQRGVFAITGTNQTATATISTVNTSKSELTFLGGTHTVTGVVYLPRIALTDSTTITATRPGNASSNSTTIVWELKEYE